MHHKRGPGIRQQRGDMGCQLRLLPARDGGRGTPHARQGLASLPGQGRATRAIGPDRHRPDQEAILPIGMEGRAARCGRLPHLLAVPVRVHRHAIPGDRHGGSRPDPGPDSIFVRPDARNHRIGHLRILRQHQHRRRGDEQPRDRRHGRGTQEEVHHLGGGHIRRTGDSTRRRGLLARVQHRHLRAIGYRGSTRELGHNGGHGIRDDPRIPRHDAGAHPVHDLRGRRDSEGQHTVTTQRAGRGRHIPIP